MSNHSHALHHLLWFAVTVVCGMALLTVISSCSQNRAMDREPPLRLDSPRAHQLAGGPQEQEEPLRLDSGEAMLLLGGKEKAAGPTESSDHSDTQSVSDESTMAYYVMCNDCHMGYIGEPLALAHAKAGMGCDSCHGRSRAHYSDESNTTPPEKMYPEDKIDPFCQGCHHSHDVPPGKVVAIWMNRKSDKTNPEKIVCTDCHGEHRMKVRTIIWDKKTGKRLHTNQGE